MPRLEQWANFPTKLRQHLIPAWVESPAGRAISLSLPFIPANVPHRGAVVANFFDNHLPDSDAIRSRFPALVRDKIFDGLQRTVKEVAADL